MPDSVGTRPDIANRTSPDGSGLDIPIAITKFPTFAASSKEERRLPLRAIVHALTVTRADAKALLPWLKLASFGDLRTPRNSLRHDGNLLSIHGLEGDYDGEQITIERARRILEQAGLAAILYTSPSHTPQAPRWRVLCPTSQPLPPAERPRLLARLNGLFVGALSRESWALSQSYYYGAVGEAPHHTVLAIDGRPIDLADELDEGAIGKPEPPKPEPSPHTPAPTLRDGTASPYGRRALELECDAIANAPDGGKHHALNKAAYSIGGLVAAGEIEHGYALASLRGALGAIRHRCDDFAHAEKTLATAFADGLAAPRAVPEATPAFDPSGLGMFQARQAGADAPAAQAQEASVEQPKHTRGIQLLSLADVEALPPPQWLVEGLVPEMGIVIPYGPPKAGKTFVALSMALHIAAGKDWMGRRVTQGGVVYVAGEGVGGLSVRIRAMRTAYQIPANIPFWIVPRAVSFRDPKAVAALFEAIKATVYDEPIGLVVLDTLARAMPGVDENSAEEVGVVVAACDELKFALSATIMPIHHAGKDMERGLRGSSAIHGALDASIQITGTGDRVTVKNDNQKDAEPAAPFILEMRKVELGLGKSSLVPFMTDEAPASRPRGRPRSGSAAVAVTALEAALAKAGQDAPAILDLASSIKVAPEAVWQREILARIPAVTGLTGKDAEREADRRRKQAARLRMAACTEGAAVSMEGFAWLP
jgi:hypothetical protein